MKTITLILTSLLLIAATSIAGPGGKRKSSCDGPEGRHFQRGDKPGHGGPGIRHLLANADEIGLSEEQVTRLEKLSTDFQLAQVDRKAAVKKAKIGLRALTRDYDSSEKKVNAAIDELAGLKAATHKARYAQRKAVHGILTDAQKDKIKQFRKERRSHTKEWGEYSRQRGERGKRGEHGW